MPDSSPAPTWHCLDRRAAALALGLCILTGALYSPLLTSFFDSSDDWKHLHAAISIPRDGLAYVSAGLDPGTPGGVSGSGSGRPVNQLVWTMDYLIWGLDAFGFQLTNVLVHAAITGLVFWLCFGLTGNLFGALVGAVWLGSNSLVDQAASGYLSGRTDQLATFFLLAAVVAWPTARTSWLGRLGVLMLYGLGCFSKIVALILPGLLLAMDFLLLDRKRPSWRTLAERYAPIAVAIVPIMLGFQAISGFDGSAPYESALDTYAGWSRFLERLWEGFVTPLWVFTQSEDVLEWELLRLMMAGLTLALAAASRTPPWRHAAFAAFWLSLSLVMPSSYLSTEWLDLRLEGRYLLLPHVAFSVLLAAGFAAVPYVKMQRTVAALVAVGTVVMFGIFGSPALGGLGERARAFFTAAAEELSPETAERRVYVGLLTGSREMESLLSSSLVRELTHSSLAPFVFVQGDRTLYEGLGGEMAILDGVLQPVNREFRLRDLARTDAIILAARITTDPVGLTFERVPDIPAPTTGAEPLDWSGRALHRWEFRRLTPSTHTDDPSDPLRVEPTSNGLNVTVADHFEAAQLGVALRESGARFPAVLVSPPLKVTPTDYCALELDLVTQFEGGTPNGDPTAGLLQNHFDKAATGALVWSSSDELTHPAAGLLTTRIPVGAGTRTVALDNAPSWWRETTVGRIAFVLSSQPAEVTVRRITLVPCR